MKREAAYQAALRSYTQVLKPGMTRKDVEDYLHQKNVEFQRMCCVDATEPSKRHSWDDLTKIGEEDSPWFCGENNVYLAFQFVDQGQHEIGRIPMIWTRYGLSAFTTGWSAASELLAYLRTRPAS